jgi:hypothetical protein
MKLNRSALVRIVSGLSWTAGKKYKIHVLKKAQIIKNHCVLSLSESPDTADVRTVCSLNSLWVKMWIPKWWACQWHRCKQFCREKPQFFCFKKRRVKKYQTDFLTFGYTNQLVNREKCPQCDVCSEVQTNSSLNARNLCRHLTRHASLAKNSQNENC